MVPTLKIVYTTIAVGTDSRTKQNNISCHSDRVLCAIVICGDRICLQELLGIVILLLLLLLLLLLYSINTEGQPGKPGSLNIELVINTNAYSNTLKLDRMG